MKPKPKQIMAGVGVSLGVLVYALVLWKGPWWFDDAPKLNSKGFQPAHGVVITGFRTALVALGAGLVAGAGLYYTRKSHEQTETLFQHTREKDREQADLTREGQVTDRYVEAIKLLSSSDTIQQLGGIYSLERIMRDSHKDHATVVAVLTAFIRESAPLPPPDSDTATTDPDVKHPGPPASVQAALTVLGRRPMRDEDFVLDLAKCDLRSADLREANLAFARLSETRLDQADLSDSDLRQAVMFDSNLDGANIERADARSACFGNSMNGVFAKGARLEGAFLADTQLRGARLERVKADHAELHHADLTHADLTEASFQGSTWLGADLSEATLSRADLTGASDLSAEQILSAWPTASTQLPADLEGDPLVIERTKDYVERILGPEN
jgi:uncharacterized protein YjbI with pentapeptide repeats